MSSQFTKPTLPPKPVPVTAAKPAAPIVAPARAAQPALDPFADIPTSGIPFDKAMAQGLRGSQAFGYPPSQAQPMASHTSPPAQEEDDWFSGEQIAIDAQVRDEPDDPDADEDDDDDGDRPEEDEELDPFAPQPAVAPVVAAVVTAVPVPSIVKPVGSKSGGVQAPKRFQLLQENDSIIFDTKLTHDLSTVEAAQDVWNNLRKPYQDMTEGDKYTRFQAGEILIRDRERRYHAARLLARAVLDANVNEEPVMLDGVEATLLLGKEAPQTQESEGLGRIEPSVAAPKVQRNPMMDACQNRTAGCQSMRLNHLQGTKQCILPTCPCKGQCQGFVEAWRADPDPVQAIQGGEAAPVGMKSPQPTAQLVASASGQVPPAAGSQGQSGRTVGAVPAPAVARPAAPVGAPVPFNAASQPVASSAQASGPVPVPNSQRPAGNAPPPAPVSAANALQRAGTVAGSGGSGQSIQSAASGGQASQAGLQQLPATPAAGVGGKAPQPVSASKPTPIAAGREQGQTGPGNTGGTGGVHTQQNAQAVAAGSGQEGQTIVTPDRLHWIMATGGNGPDYSDFWPTIPNQDMRAEVVERRMYVQGKVVDFYTKAFNAKKNFDFASNSYRVVLAASTLSAAIEEYAISGLGLPAGANDATEKELYSKVGAAAQAYVAAHEPLTAGQIDVPWKEYTEYIELYKDAGLKVGMLLHEFGQQSQTQG